MKRTWLKRNWLWSIFLAASVISPAAAQQQPLTLEDCLRLALQAPSTVQSAERDQAIAAERQTAARAGLLPQLALNSQLDSRAVLVPHRGSIVQSFV